MTSMRKHRESRGWSEQPKDERLIVCLPPSLKATIEKSANKVGLPMATHARQLLRLAVEYRNNQGNSK